MADRYGLKVDIAGLFHNMPDPRRGSIVELDPASAKRYLAAGYVERKLTGEVGRQFAPEK